MDETGRENFLATAGKSGAIVMVVSRLDPTRKLAIFKNDKTESISAS